MKTAVYHAPEDIENALARLGLTAAPLTQAIQHGHLARCSCTANDAPNAPGYYQWNATLRGLREGLVVHDWSRCDDGNYATIVSPDGSIAISVASGNIDTGSPAANPCTRSSKGPNTAAAVHINAAQLELFPRSSPPPVHDGNETRATWLLLFYTDAKEIRSELSLPVSIDAEGNIMAWKERIILPAQPIDSDVSLPEPDFGPDVNIEISRQA
jgi:hypothetical protein